jgi:hypothetical protein
LGFDKAPDLYRRIDAAVAFIVLERAEQRLPQWSAVRDDELILGRERRGASKIPNRKVLLQPRHLFTINWADNGPGFSWPVAYYVTWLPYYDRHVVTASADCPDAFGYCDFALGAFSIDTPIKEGARKIIVDDWADQRGREQQRWAYLFSTELISKQEAEAWAEKVWPSERSEEESLEEEPAETDGAKVSKITFRDYAPSDPVYSEGPQSYSPHWGRTLLKPQEPSPANTVGCQTQQPAYPVTQKQHSSPPKPEKPPSKTLSDEQERLVAEIKRHHPMATTEGILKHLKEWGVE